MSTHQSSHLLHTLIIAQCANTHIYRRVVSACMQRIIACSMNGRVVIRFFYCFFPVNLFSMRRTICVNLKSFCSRFTHRPSLNTFAHVPTHTRKCVPISHSPFVVVVLVSIKLNNARNVVVIRGGCVRVHSIPLKCYSRVDVWCECVCVYTDEMSR